MKVQLRKTNPTKSMFGNLIAVTTFAHLVSLLFRPEVPGAYTALSPFVPFPVVVLLAIIGLALWVAGSITHDWKTLQLSFPFTGAFFTMINLSLISLGLFNGAIMWTAGIVVIAMTMKMSPVELIRKR